ncbi:TetR/AcrR family transcriptional regulator, partial [Klebsiella pneumoniae]|uniref:TetR/AcrR family transcriptional regulator n=9 Tax=Klebsiella pneumoniae TaxID=573 RepID=UPI00101379DE
MRADARKNYDLLIEVARDVFVEQGAEASLRDIARRAGVGMGTLYRHFPNRDSLLEALLRSRFAALTARAESLLLAADPAAALLEWLAESVAFTHQHRGIIAPLMSAIDDPESALHCACVALRAAGTSLLTRAQQAGLARPDLSGEELFDLIAALAWLREQPSHAPRAERILAVLADAILVTLVLAGFAALVQTDIKRVLAYSTMSQIGYMFLALGVQAWDA